MKKSMKEIIELMRAYFKHYIPNNIATFLDASSHLYMRSCPSVGRMVGPSLCNAFFLNGENEPFSL